MTLKIIGAYTLYGEQEHETDDAVLVDNDEFGEVWIPRSQIVEDHLDEEESYLVITNWIAREKGFIE